MIEQHAAQLKGLFVHNETVSGTKGLVFIGDKILVYRRDGNTNQYPYMLDVPGGGQEGQETPFDTFSREAKEEFGLTIRPNDIVYARKYPSSVEKGTFGYFIVARLSAAVHQQIVFGDEGEEFMLMDINEYLRRTDAWPVFQERTKDYLSSSS